MAFNEINEINNSEIENLIHSEEEELRRMQIAEELEAEGPVSDINDSPQLTKHNKETSYSQKALDAATNRMPDDHTKMAFLYIFSNQRPTDLLNWTESKNKSIAFLENGAGLPHDEAVRATETALQYGYQYLDEAKETPAKTADIHASMKPYVQNPKAKETKVIYEGFFLNGEEKENAMAFVDSISEMSGDGRLDKVIGDMHITTGFGKNAQGFDINAIGEDVDIEITGYANDGKNEAISVSLSSENPDLQSKFDKLQNPHITVSVGEGGRPFDSGKLSFEPLPDYFAGEFKLTGQYGVFTDRGVVATREQAEKIFEVKLDKLPTPMNNKDTRI